MVTKHFWFFLIFLSLLIDVWKELWKHQAKLYISSFSSKSKPVTQRKNKAFWNHIICFCSNNVLFLDLIVSSILVPFQSYKNLWVHHIKLIVAYLSSINKGTTPKKPWKIMTVLKFKMWIKSMTEHWPVYFWQLYLPHLFCRLFWTF